jgi:hypothetical protein
MPSENLDRTQPVPSSPASADTSADTVAAQVDERTQEVPASPSQRPHDPTTPRPTQEDLDKQLARELSRRGVPADEVGRMVALARGEPIKPSSKKAAAIPVSPPPIPPSEAYEPKPTITLPEFREPTTQERMEADRLLTSANIARRRGNFAEAERLCAEAIQLMPRDAAALEIYGDVLQGVGRVDDALYAYQRATEADSKRRSAEKKYAELMLLQNREIDLLRQEYIPRNPNVAVLLSAVGPGTGQIYNGDLLKGVVIAALFVMFIYTIFFTPYGLPHTRAGIPTSLVLSIVGACAVYIFAIVDANLSARRGKIPKSGWDV